MNARNALNCALCAACFAVSPAVAQIKQSGAELISKVPADVEFSGEVQRPALPPNGSFILFSSNQPQLVPGGTAEVFFVSTEGRAAKQSLQARASRGGSPAGDVTEPAVSQVLLDGSYATVFTSPATDIIAGYREPIVGGQNPQQVYLRLEPSGNTVLLSRGINHATQQPDPQLGADGDSFLGQVALVPGTTPVVVFAFLSRASNIVGNYNGEASAPYFGRVSLGANPLEVQLEAPIFPRPDNECLGLFLSGSGSALAFSSRARNLIKPARDCTACSEQVYIFDRTKKKLGLLSYRPESDNEASDGDNYLPSISFDATVASFITTATDFGGASNRPIVAAREKETETVTNLSTSSDKKTKSTGSAIDARLSPSGLYVTFTDNGDNLVPGLINSAAIGQVYVKHRLTGEIVLVSQSASGSEGDRPSTLASIGALSFNSLDAISAFRSSANSLGGPPLSRQTASRLFRNELTIPPPPLSSNLPISVPPDLKVTQRSITLKLQRFRVGSAGTTSSEADVAANRVRYSVEIQKTTGRRERILRTTTRNQVTIRRLSPGRYTVRYRASGKTNGGKTLTTRFSPKQPFVIT